MEGRAVFSFRENYGFALKSHKQFVEIWIVVVVVPMFSQFSEIFEWVRRSQLPLNPLLPHELPSQGVGLVACSAPAHFTMFLSNANPNLHKQQALALLLYLTSAAISANKYGNVLWLFAFIDSDPRVSYFFVYIGFLLRTNDIGTSLPQSMSS